MPHSPHRNTDSTESHSRLSEGAPKANPASSSGSLYHSWNCRGDPDDLAGPDGHYFGRRGVRLVGNVEGGLSRLDVGHLLVVVRVEPSREGPPGSDSKWFVANWSVPDAAETGFRTLWTPSGPRSTSTSSVATSRTSVRNVNSFPRRLPKAATTGRVKLSTNHISVCRLSSSFDR